MITVFKHSFIWLNQSHIHWAWIHIYIKDQKDTNTRNYQRQDNHIITVIKFDLGETEEMRKQSINTERLRRIPYQF